MPGVHRRSPFRIGPKQPRSKTDRNPLLFPLLEGYDISDAEKLHRAISSRNALANKYLKVLAKRTNIDKHITFHLAPHSFALFAIRNEWEVFDIYKALGHRNLKDTETYLRGFSAEDLDDKVKQLLGDPDVRIAYILSIA
ncbi:MAG: tyrosine-type recombinase/integrase [Bacteroidota bacterium]